MKTKQRSVVSMMLAAVMLLAGVVALSGCGKSATLEEFMNTNDDAKKIVKTMESTMNTSMTTGKVETKDNTISVTLKYKSTFSNAQLPTMKKSLASSFGKENSAFKNFREQLKKESKIDGIVLKLVVQNGDGKEIYSTEYK